MLLSLVEVRLLIDHVEVAVDVVGHLLAASGAGRAGSVGKLALHVEGIQISRFGGTVIASPRSYAQQETQADHVSLSSFVVGNLVFLLLLVLVLAVEAWLFGWMMGR